MSLPDWNDGDLQAAAPVLDAWISAYNLPRSVIYGQCSQESRFKPMAFLMDRNGGSYGLMQMSYPTAQGLGYTGDPSGLYDPNTNVQLGCAFMAQLLQQYGNVFDALSAYNAGHIGTTAGSSYATQVLARAQYFDSLWANTSGGFTLSSDANPLDASGGTVDSSGGGTTAALLIGALALAGAALWGASR